MAEVIDYDDLEDAELIAESDSFAQVATDILDAVERDEHGKWTLPWHVTNGGRPQNSFSGRRFRGSNALTLWSAAKRFGFSTHQWASEAAWERRGGLIAPDVPGTWILIPIFDTEDDPTKWTNRTPSIKKKVGVLGGDPEGGEFRRVIGYKRALWFNAAQVSGVTVADPVRPSPSEAANKVIDALSRWRGNKGPALVFGGSSAHWSATHDRITMPDKKAFPDQEGISGLEFYAGVLAHENVHASGSKNRLNRTTLEYYHKRKEARIREELVAEIGAAFFAAHFGLQTVLRPDHSRYVNSWLSSLMDEKKRGYFFWAVREAEKAVDFILKRASREVVGL